jgi:hypothetical protein
MGFTWFPQVFCGFFGFLCDLGHKMGDFTGDYWRFGVCGGSGLGKTNLAKTPFELSRWRGGCCICGGERLA